MTDSQTQIQLQLTQQAYQAFLDAVQALSPIASSAPPMSEHLFSAWGEFAVFSGYAAVLLALGAWLFIRRDA